MEGHQGDEYDEALSTLAELEDIGWKVRLCLMDTQRALNFLVRKARLPAGQLEQAREILRDIESLLPHNESLFQKVNFLMQAAMGLSISSRTASSRSSRWSRWYSCRQLWWPPVTG